MCNKVEITQNRGVVVYNEGVWGRPRREKKRRSDQQALIREIGIFKLKVKGPERWLEISQGTEKPGRYKQSSALDRGRKWTEDPENTRTGKGGGDQLVGKRGCLKGYRGRGRSGLHWKSPRGEN